MNILLADDEKPLLNFLARGLGAEGYECTTLSELHEILPYVRKHQPQIIVIDRLFGSEDSISIIGSIKSLPTPPMILMLTALDEVSERVKGLHQGADDYLCKPFDFDELLARVAALSRYVSTEKTTPDDILVFGSLKIALDERIARINNQEIALTKIEFELLLYLVQNAEKVLSRERILSRVWQTYNDPQTNAVDVYISKLRKKLDSDPAITIQTLRGNGYRLGMNDLSDRP